MAAVIFAAAVASAFNLTCDIQRFSIIGDTVPAATHMTSIYRIDLSASRWCNGECSETKPIAVIDEQNIVLTNKGSRTGAFERTIINRESGHFEGSVGYAGMWSQADRGTCQRVPFTGFPSLKF